MIKQNLIKYEKNTNKKKYNNETKYNTVGPHQSVIGGTFSQKSTTLFAVSFSQVITNVQI